MTYLPPSPDFPSHPSIYFSSPTSSVLALNCSTHPLKLPQFTLQVHPPNVFFLFLSLSLHFFLWPGPETRTPTQPLHIFLPPFPPSLERERERERGGGGGNVFHKAIGYGRECLLFLYLFFTRNEIRLVK